MSFFEIEPEILDGMKALPATQELFAGANRDVRMSNPIRCGWYGTSVDARRGAFCFVNEDPQWADLVGEFLRVTHGQRSVVVYCLGATNRISTPIALYRRPYMSLELAAITGILTYVQVVE